MLFISYSRQNSTQVYRFADALQQAGVQIWLDREAINPLDDFPERIRDGLSRCHALLAWYSETYATSAYCQKELTAAWIASASLTRDVTSRVFIVNPLSGLSHIALGDVGRQNYLSAPTDEESESACVQAIRDRLAGLAGDFSAARQFATPTWYPRPKQQGSARFAGRTQELWRIHTALNPVGIFAHEASSPVAQLRGMGGSGKTLLAIEYASRFAAAYPGGIFWLRGGGVTSDERIDPGLREAERRLQIENIANELDIAVLGVDFRILRRMLAIQLAAQSAPYLWIVDDLPSGLTPDELQGWYALTPNGHTLISTRSAEYEGIGATVEVEGLDPASALQLLTVARRATSDEEHRAASGLIEDLGFHALAIDVAGHFLLRTRGFEALRRDLAQYELDPLGEFVSGLRGHLPGGHEKSLVATLLASLTLLDEEGLELLRLACELRAGTPIPHALSEPTLGNVSAREGPAARENLARAINQLEVQSLVQLGHDVLSIPAVVRYTMMRRDPLGSCAARRRRALREAAVSALGELLQDSGLLSRPHLEVAIGHARHLAFGARTLGQAFLCARIASFSGDHGQYAEALALTRSAVGIFDFHLGAEHADTLVLLGDIAFWEAKLGHYAAAIAQGQAVLAIQGRILGLDHPHTLRIRQNLALWTGLQGDLAGALRQAQLVLDDTTRVLGVLHADTLNARHTFIHWIGRTGDARQALTSLHDLMLDVHKALQADHPLVRTLRFSMAYWTGQSGNASQALELFSCILEEDGKRLGFSHPEILDTQCNIATLTGMSGDACEAMRLLSLLLPRYVALLGADHPETFIVRQHLAHWTGCSGDPHVALSMLRALHADQAGILGRKHPQSLVTLANVAAWAARCGFIGESGALFGALLPDLESVFGQDHPHTAKTRANLRLLAGGDDAKCLLSATYTDLSDPDDLVWAMGRR